MRRKATKHSPLFRAIRGQPKRGSLDDNNPRKKRRRKQRKEAESPYVHESNSDEREEQNEEGIDSKDLPARKFLESLDGSGQVTTTCSKEGGNVVRSRR
jgi:hypothetical protein